MMSIIRDNSYGMNEFDLNNGFKIRRWLLKLCDSNDIVCENTQTSNIMTAKLGMLQYWRNNVKSENDIKCFSIIDNHNIKKYIIHINKNSYTIFVFTVNACN